MDRAALSLSLSLCPRVSLLPHLGAITPGSSRDHSLAWPGGCGAFWSCPGKVRGAGEPPHLGTARRGGSQARVGAPRKPLAGSHQAGLSCEAHWVLCFENILKTLGYPNNVSKTFLFALKRWKDSFLSGLRGPGSRGQEGPLPPFPPRPSVSTSPWTCTETMSPARTFPGFSYHSGFHPLSSLSSPAEQDLARASRKDTPMLGQAGRWRGPKAHGGGPRPQEGSNSPEPRGLRGGHRTEARFRPRAPGLATSSSECQLTLLLGAGLLPHHPGDTPK